MEPYYYTKMDKSKQAAYYAIYQGLMALSDSFQVPKLEGRELSDVFFQLRLDHPEIFWAEGFYYRYYQDSANITFLPEYIFEKGKIKEHQKALKATLAFKAFWCSFIFPFSKIYSGKKVILAES